MINAKINFNNINKETKNEIINNLISNFNKLLDKELKETLNQNEFIIFKLDDFIYDNNNTFWFILFYYEKLKEYEFKQKNLFKLITTEENDNNLINLKILLKMESIGYIFITQNFTNNFDLFFKNLFNFNNNYQIEFINFKV
jgi:hypothetical protein